MNAAHALPPSGTQDPEFKIQNIIAAPPLAAQPGWLCSSLAAPFLLVAWLLLALLPLANADAPDGPVFAGPTITINGIGYTFASATESESTVNNVTFTVHTDNYVSAGGTVSLQGRLAVSQPAFASVNGNSGGVPFSGIWSGAAYYPNGYFPREAGASIGVGDGQVFWVMGGDYKSFDANWHLQVSHSKDIYRYSNLTLFTVEVDGAGNGHISGVRTGCMFAGTPHFDHHVLASTYGESSYVLFGSAYSIARIEFYLAGQGNAQLLGATEKYVGGNGGNLSVYHPDILASPANASGTFSGNDPNIGDFGGSFNTPKALIFDRNRSAPSFAGRNLWVNSTLVTWNPAPIVNAAGDVVDTYSVAGVETGPIMLTVSGNLPAFKWPEATNPTVELNDPFAAGSVIMGSYVKGAPSYFSVPGWYVGAADFTRLAPLCLPSTPYLWANGTRYIFRGGVDDETGNSVDTYVNPSAGELVLTGNWPAGVHFANVRLSYHGEVHSGTYSSAENAGFSFPDDTHVGKTGPTPLAFSVSGSLYRITEGSDFAYATADGHALTATETAGGLLLSGEDAVSAFAGTWTTGSALFVCTRTAGGSAGQLLPACPAQWDASLMLNGASAPEHLPPAIKVEGVIRTYIGSLPEDGVPANMAAYYGHASAGGLGSKLLRIGSDHVTVTFTDFAVSDSTTGTYSTTTHLFQSAPGQLPMPIYGTDPQDNNVRWGWLTPKSGRPAIALVGGEGGVGGEAWGFTHSDAGGDHYSGYYEGQEIAIANGRDGYGVVTLSTAGTSYSGTYYNNAFQMAGGPEVASGDKAGTYVAPTGLSLSTTGADLDVLGNLFSLGSLKTNASIVGLTLQFADVAGTAKLYSTLSRPQAEWIWNRADGSAIPIPIPMMKLGSGNALSLFDPWDPTYAPITLNPAGRSRFDGPIRIEPQGDLDMGVFRHGPGERE